MIANKNVSFYPSRDKSDYVKCNLSVKFKILNCYFKLALCYN